VFGNVYSKEFSVNEIFPVLDFNKLREGAVDGPAELQRLRRACNETGFFLVGNHGIDTELVEALFSASTEFFELPVDVKNTARPEQGTFHAGYHGFAEDFLALGEDDPSPPDLRELFVVARHEKEDLSTPDGMTPSPFHHPNIWPQGSDQLRQVSRAYSNALEELSSQLMSAIARSLDLPTDYFTPMLGDHFNALSIAHYPPLGGPALPGQLRASPHTDYGSLTVLLPNNSKGGLQVQVADGRWLDVPLVKGVFVVNVGDLVEMWTNGYYRSAVHRVCNPASEDGESARRISIVYFQHPAPQAPMTYVAGLAPAGLARHPEFPTAGDFMWSIMNKIAPTLAATK
jgi:isopenicillin N synthase-like dioxygenase